MESQPQTPEFRINPENFHPWYRAYKLCFDALHPSQQFFNDVRGFSYLSKFV